MQSREINPSSPPRSSPHSTASVLPLTASPPTVVDIDAIELEKENIQPIRQGRSAQALTRLFASQPEERAQELARQRQEFDDQLERIDQAADPLDVYSRYVSWTTRNYPQSSGQGHHSRLLPLLEQAIKQFQDKTSYKNDPRFVKMLILYSEMVDLPEDVFNFMETKSIGIEIASYYEAYAEYLETNEDFDKARDIYLLGINRTARPQGLLRSRLHEFQHRVQIHQEKLENEAFEASSTSATAEPTNRRVLGAKISRSESVHSNVTAQGHVTLGSGASSSSMASTRPSSSSTQQRPNARLTVYSDSNQSVPPSSRTKQKQENASWKDLGTQQVCRKENIREPTSWEGARLTAKDSFARRPHPKLEVFKDPDGVCFEEPVAAAL
ncbi:Mad3/BUB1 homology region 1-domain-containing protein [Dissophora ornata]|nr:Mad3/BUB1 homology region 1-domain-containing protein [Dissophora ornata]